jgi:hypothetical protein
MGFPLNTNDITVTFSDGTSCTVISSTDIEFQCEVEGFDASTIDTENPY